MFYNGIQPQYKIERKDLISFKNFTLIFALTRINGFFENFWISLFGIVLGSIVDILIEYGGLIILVYGFYMLTKRNSSLPSANKLIFWFTLAIIISLTRIIFNLVFVNLTSASQSINMLSLNSTNSTNPTTSTPIIRSVNMVVMYITIFYILIIGIIIYLIAKYLTDWFNDIFGLYNPTKAYYFFGLLFCLGSILASVGFFEILLTQNNSFNQWPGFVMTAGGAILILISFFIEIVAGFKIYNRVNDMVLGKMPFHLMYPYPYQSPYQNPYQPPYQQPVQNLNDPQKLNNNQKTNYQIAYQNKGMEQSQNNDEKGKSFKFCSNCGIKLDREDNFCKNCGFRF